MVRTQIIRAQGAGPVSILRDLSEIDSFDFERDFKEAGLVVIDDMPWEADLSVICAGLDPRPRVFKAPFIEHEPTKEVALQVGLLVGCARRLFSQLYPSFKATEVRTSFRPMITGPEPLHFDTYGGPNPLVTAYINVSDVPRVYGIGPSFPMLVERQPKVLRKLEVKKGDLSYAIRQRTMQGEPPLGRDTPRHHVELAPGAIWFFNAKTVSHEVIYGRGTVGVSWEVPDVKGIMQADLMRAIR